MGEGRRSTRAWLAVLGGGLVMALLGACGNDGSTPDPDDLEQPTSDGFSD